MVFLLALFFLTGLPILLSHLIEKVFLKSPDKTLEGYRLIGLVNYLTILGRTFCTNQSSRCLIFYGWTLVSQVPTQVRLLPDFTKNLVLPSWAVPFWGHWACLAANLIVLNISWLDLQSFVLTNYLMFEARYSLHKWNYPLVV